MRASVNNFYDYLKGSEKDLKRMKDEIKEAADAKRQF